MNRNTNSLVWFKAFEVEWRGRLIELIKNVRFSGRLFGSNHFVFLFFGSFWEQDAILRRWVAQPGVSSEFVDDIGRAPGVGLDVINPAMEQGANDDCRCDYDCVRSIHNSFSLSQNGLVRQ